MKKEDLAWLLIRFLGIVCLCFALHQLFAAAGFVPQLIEEYKELARATDHEQYRTRVTGYWTMHGWFGSQGLAAAAFSVFGLYCIRRGKWLHALLLK